jgi:hypothetical protein
MTGWHRATVMTQQLASFFEQAIREHPKDWHLPRRVFVVGLDPARLARTWRMSSWITPGAATSRARAYPRRNP